MWAPACQWQRGFVVPSRGGGGDVPRRAVLAKAVAAQLAHVASDGAGLAAEIARPIAAVAARGQLGLAEELRQHEEPERVEGEVLLYGEDRRLVRVRRLVPVVQGVGVDAHAHGQTSMDSGGWMNRSSPARRPRCSFRRKKQHTPLP